MPIQEEKSLRSEQLRDFISHRPGLLVRRVIPILFVLLLLLAAGSYFIQYPDVVQARASVQSVNAPKQVIIKNGGRLIRLFKEDGSDIRQDEVIGYMESTGSHDEVLNLSAILDTLQYFADSNRLEEIPRFWNDNRQSFSRLGELQSAHQTFMQGYVQFKDYLSTGFYPTKKLMLQRDLANTRKLLGTLQQQKDLQQQDLTIIQKNYDVHDTLHKEALVNDFDYRNQQSQLINKKMNIPQMNASIINNEGQQNALQKEMMELDNQIAQQRTVFVQGLNAYRNVVEDWKQKHLLISPVSGRLVYAGFPQENQQFKTGQVIGYVTNPSNQYFVEMLVPQTNFGKVKAGQSVLLKFPSYPSQEFGSIKGRIEFVKSIPSDSGYLAKVSLPDGLITNYKKNILFVEGLSAQAEIITEKKRLSERLFGRIGRAGN